MSAADLSVSGISDDGNVATSVKVSYNIDDSTNLAGRMVLGNGWISSIQYLEGTGINKIDLMANNKKASVSSIIRSTGLLRTTASVYASADIVQVGHSIQSSGQSDSSVSGAINSASTAQNAGVLEGYMMSSQMITAGSGKIRALQATNLAGALGYADGVARSSDNIVHLTGGLNGVGGMSCTLDTTASVDVSATGSFQADSLESKAYSAVKSTSSHADAYTYISSAGHLESSMSGSANGHVTSNQEFDANGKVRVYLSSTSDDSPTEIYDVEGESLSGSISASAGSPAVIDTILVGDFESQEASFISTPGSWVWNGFGGIITSNPYQLLADGKNHIFTKGGDNGLWDNADGAWYSLEGFIKSNPNAIRDKEGKLHVAAVGGDNGLWVNTVGIGTTPTTLVGSFACDCN